MIFSKSFKANERDASLYTHVCVYICVVCAYICISKVWKDEAWKLKNSKICMTE